jgi:hypothetical protein
VRCSLAVAVALAAPALAHELPHPRRDLFRVTPAGLQVELEILVQPGEPARSLRGMFDRDRDGRLQPEERSRCEEYLARTAAQFLAVTADGAKLSFTQSKVRSENLDGPASSTLLAAAVISLEAKWPAGRAPERLEIADRHPDREIHVPAVVIVDTALELRGASQGLARKEDGALAGVDLQEGKPLALRLRVR